MNSKQQNHKIMKIINTGKLVRVVNHKWRKQCRRDGTASIARHNERTQALAMPRAQWRDAGRSCTRGHVRTYSRHGTPQRRGRPAGRHGVIAWAASPSRRAAKGVSPRVKANRCGGTVARSALPICPAGPACWCAAPGHPRSAHACTAQAQLATVACVSGG